VAIRDKSRTSIFNGRLYQKALAWTTDRALADRILKMLNDDDSPEWSLEARVASLERWRREVDAPCQFNVLEGG
jgi:hypothetical protein